MMQEIENQKSTAIVPDEPMKPERSRITEIRENIKAGLAWVKQGNYTKKDERWENWKRWKAMIDCRWDAKEVVEKHGKMNFPVNNPFANFHTVKPGLYFKNPKIQCVAKRPVFYRTDATPENPKGDIAKDDQGRPQIRSSNYMAAKKMELRINQLCDQVNLSNVVKRCVSDCLAPYGIGWAKVGYQKLSVAEFDNSNDTKVTYWVERIDPRRVVFDWMATEPSKMRYVATQYCLPRKEVEEAGFKLPKNYQGSLPEWYQDRAENSNETSKGHSRGCTEEMVVFWEYEDLVQKTIDWVIIDAPGDEYFYMKDTSVEPYPFKGGSLRCLVLTEDGDDIIGKCDMEPVEPQIVAINKMREREVDHIENYGTGVMFEDGAIDPTELKKYQKTSFGWAVKTKAGGFNKIKTVSTPPIGNDHYQMSGMHKDEMRNILAISDYQQGGSSVDRKATEAQIISAATTVRVEAKRDSISKFIISIIQCFDAMVQEFDDEFDFIPIVDEDLDEKFKEMLKKENSYNPDIPFLGMSRDDLQGEFNWSHNVEDMIVMPKEVQAAQLSRSMTAVGSNPYFTQKFIEDYDVGKVICKMFELNGVDLEEFKKGGAVQVPAGVENEMFKLGMEVPEPHDKDHDDEHVLVHRSLQKEIDGQLMQVAQQMSTLQSGVQMIPEQMGHDPMGAQQAMQQAQAQIDQLMMQMEPLEMMLRNVKIHIQNHGQRSMRKLKETPAGQFGNAPTGQPQNGQPAQPAQQATPAQAPGPGTVV